MSLWVDAMSFETLDERLGDFCPTCDQRTRGRLGYAVTIDGETYVGQVIACLNCEDDGNG